VEQNLLIWQKAKNYTVFWNNQQGALQTASQHDIFKCFFGLLSRQICLSSSLFNSKDLHHLHKIAKTRHQKKPLRRVAFVEVN